jgi:hypothetical protein
VANKPVVVVEVPAVLVVTWAQVHHQAVVVSQVLVVQE